MVIAGFSINVLTLLGAVLAIGLVVDDAIVVLENIVRRIEDGEPPLIAAVDGSREIGFAVIATTLVLIAVFLPISYLPGNLGRLFGEFGITIAAAIAFSALVSLTLVPMMSSKIFAHGVVRGRVAHARRAFLPLAVAARTSARCARAMQRAAARSSALAVAAHCCSACVLFRVLPTEYAPPEDRAHGADHAHRAGRREPAVHGSLPAAGRSRSRSEEVENGQRAARAVARSGNFGGGGDVNVGRVVLPLSIRGTSARNRRSEIVAAHARRSCRTCRACASSS